MALPPTNFDVYLDATGGAHELSWINEAVYTSMAVQRKTGAGGTYATIKAIAYPTESYTDKDAYFTNTAYYYRISTNEGYSNEDHCTAWTADPSTDTVTMTDMNTLRLAVSLTILDGFSMGDATEVEHETTPAEPQEYTVTETDTLTMSDSAETTLITGQNWMYYLGSSIGGVYPYGPDYHGDAGADINSYYESKALDFSDQHPQVSGAWKTISYVYLDYVDKGEIPITIWISADNGTTWVSRDKTIGNGSYTVKTSRFDFWISGAFFVVKLSHSSNDRDFQWARMRIEYEPQADR